MFLTAFLCPQSFVDHARRTLSWNAEQSLVHGNEHIGLDCWTPSRTLARKYTRRLGAGGLSRHARVFWMPSASAPQSSLGGPRDTMVAAMANPSSDIRLSRQSNTDSCGDAGSSVGMTRTSRSELSGYDMNGSSEHGDPSIGKALELKMEADTTFSPAFKVSPPTPPRPMYPSQRPVAPHACMGNSGRMEAEDVKPGAEDRAGNRTQYVGTGRTPGDERFAERFGDRLGDRFGDRFCDRHSDSSGVSIGDLHSERSSSSFTRTPALRADDKLGGRSSMDGGGRVEAQQDLSVKQGSKSSEADEEVDSRAGSSPSQSNGRVAQIAEGESYFR